ncbi:hypothetical protein [Microcoleus sp. Pol12B5]|uniref:hypothetical protein n=1 Tax=unclassified Microcoleus TaxID=2642155 RepID=UPI002FD5AE64
MNLIESEKQVTIALIGFPLITYWLTTYCPIAHFSQIRSPDPHKNSIAPINKKPDRPSTKNPIARPQKPGFFRNTSVQPTDSGKNPVSWIIPRR